MSRANELLGIAGESHAGNPAYGPRCWAAHDAAELALKGVIVAKGGQYPTVHKIEGLLHSLERQGEKIPAELQKARALSQHGGRGRYKDMEAARTPATKEDWIRAVEQARQVVKWARKRVMDLTVPPPPERPRPAGRVENNTEQKKGYEH